MNSQTITVKKETVLELILSSTSAVSQSNELLCLMESLLGGVVKEGGYDSVWDFCQSMAVEKEVLNQ